MREGGRRVKRRGGGGDGEERIRKERGRGEGEMKGGKREWCSISTCY